MSTTQVTVTPAKSKKSTISFAGVRWDRMTNAEVAKQVFNDPKNAGAIRTKSLKNFAVTVFLKRKQLIASGRETAKFAGRVVNGVRKEKYVHSKGEAVDSTPTVE